SVSQSVNILMRIIVLILGIFITFFSYNRSALANVFPDIPTQNANKISHQAEIRVLSQNVQRNHDGQLSFSTTYAIQNQSDKSIQQIAWYAVYIFNNRIIDNRFINLKFNQFNILKPDQKYYLSTLLPEEEMTDFSKNLFTNDAKKITIKPVIKFIQFDDGTTITK
ncbi:hypothetical protein QV08_01060, partial [Gallibacterium salpingitidis]